MVLQSIYQINICRKSSFPMEISLVFILIELANLSLNWQIFADWVNFIVHTCDIKNKQIYHYLLLKEKVKLHIVVYFIPNKFRSLPQGISKVVLITDLNIYRKSSGDSQFHTNILFSLYLLSKYVLNTNSKPHAILIDWGKRKSEIESLW